MLVVPCGPSSTTSDGPSFFIAACMGPPGRMGVRVLMPARERHRTPHAPNKDAPPAQVPRAECHQMLRFGSPVFEMASAIQARALALSATRSAREGALSFSPPAAMYCCANLPSDRQFSELSYFTFRSRTSATQRLAAPLI